MKKGLWHIIVAAGRGTRFDSDLPKQWHLLDGKPVLMHTIERFREATPESEILVVLSKHDIEYWQNLCFKYEFMSPPVVFGGSTRWESVRNAVEMIPDASDLYIMVHDGARPLVSKQIIYNVLDALEHGADGAVPCVPVIDSLRYINENGDSRPVDRSKYVAVQTPQGFRGELLKKAYRLPYEPEFTDDASIMSVAGFPNLKLVAGSRYNIKITHPFDLITAELILSHKWTD